MSERQDSGIKLVSVLVIIAAGSGALLAVTHKLTEKPIEISVANETLAAVKEVLPRFANDPDKERIVVEGKDGKVECFPARDKDGNLIGIAVPGVSHAGYGGDLRIMVGILMDGTVCGMKVLEMSETPGLGTRIAEEGFFAGIQEAQEKEKDDFVWKVKKDGGSVDQVTGATISSRAAVDAIRNARDVFAVATGQVKGGLTTKDLVEPLTKVLPLLANNPLEDRISLNTDDGPVDFFPARNQKGELLAVAVPSVGEQGFYGPIHVLVGITKEGKVIGIEVLEHAETQGLGSPEEGTFLGQFKGRSLEDAGFVWRLKNNGGDIDAMTNATVSSAAVLDAVTKALALFESTKEELR